MSGNVLTKALDDALADGRWHPFDELVEAIAKAVPPGEAYRRAEAERARSATRAGRTAGARSRGDEATAVASGARRIARDLIRRRVDRGTLERKGNRLRRRIAA
jgi:hypothetical protein